MQNLFGKIVSIALIVTLIVLFSLFPPRSSKAEGFSEPLNERLKSGDQKQIIDSNLMQLFVFPQTTARYVKYVGHGNNKNDWNSIAEFQVYAPSSAGGVLAPQSSLAQEQKGVLETAATKPGLYNADGMPHMPHVDNPVKGKTINVIDYGADPSDSGKDDTTALNAAINAAQSGDEVYLPNGVYNLIGTLSNDKSSNLDLKSGVNLRGETQDGVILLSSFQNSTLNTKVIKALGKENIVISQLTVSSVYDGQYSTDSKTSNPDKGGPLTGIYIEDTASKTSHNITIDHVTVEKYERMGIRISKSHDVIVRNSLFRDATDLGGGGAGYGVVFQGIAKVNRIGYENDTYFNLAENNRFEGPYIRHGALVQNYAHNNTVRNNYFANTALDSIDLHGEFEYLNEIDGNTIDGTLTGAGVGVGNTGGMAPSNHSASGPYNYIHDNLITNSRDGITVTMGTPNTIIENNTITGSVVKDGTGITVLNGPGTILRGNQIYGNTADHFWGILLNHDPGDKGAKFIGQGDPQDVQIEGNNVYNNSNGVKISVGTNILLKDNNIHDNQNQDFLNNATPSVTN